MMKDVRIDANGDLRCWRCGGKSFTAKRTFRAKAALGVGALLTRKKLRCNACGDYNQTGHAKPYADATPAVSDTTPAVAQTPAVAATATPKETKEARHAGPSTFRLLMKALLGRTPITTAVLPDGRPILVPKATEPESPHTSTRLTARRRAKAASTPKGGK
jgi:hypothetical protein